MYYVNNELGVNGGKVIMIAGMTKQGVFVDGAMVLAPGESWKGKPFEWWELGKGYTEDLTEIDPTWRSED